LESLLTQVKPYMIIKQTQAILALEFLHSRLNRANRAAFSEREIEILFDLRVANAHNSKSRVFVYNKRPYTLVQFKKLVLSSRQNPNYWVVEWTPEMDGLLGTDSDRAIAERLGLKLAAVQRRRFSLRIRPCKATRMKEARYC